MGMTGDTFGLSLPHLLRKHPAMKTPFTLLATAAALLIATGAAHAGALPSIGSISSEDGFGPAGTDWETPGKLLQLSQFDPLLGTLTAVHFQWRGALNSNFQGVNNGSGQNILRYSASGSMGFSLPLPTSAQLVFGPQEGVILLAPGEDKTVPILLEITGGGGFVGNLASFVGEDTFDVRVVAQGDSYLIEESGNVDFLATTTASAWVKVTYDYTANGSPVPEPGALSLLGLALASAGIASRRRA